MPYFDVFKQSKYVYDREEAINPKLPNYFVCAPVIFPTIGWCRIHLIIHRHLTRLEQLYLLINYFNPS